MALLKFTKNWSHSFFLSLQIPFPKQLLKYILDGRGLRLSGNYL